LARDGEALGSGDGGEEGGVVLEVGGDDFVKKAGLDLGEDEVEAIGGVEGKRGEVVAGGEFEELEDFGAGEGDFLVGGFAPRVFDAFAAGVEVVVVVGEGVDDGLGAEALAGGVKVDVAIA